ncbi:MAG: thymidylate kinase, partial [Oscillospiraceae bacterium]|nr:thymidylate kinase [Oscillospiraceae bacterium]
SADIHEKDAGYLRQCRENAAEIVRRLGWRRIDCSRGGAVRTPEDIHQEVWSLVKAMLWEREG